MQQTECWLKRLLRFKAHQSNKLRRVTWIIVWWESGGRVTVYDSSVVSFEYLERMQAMTELSINSSEHPGPFLPFNCSYCLLLGEWVWARASSTLSNSDWRCTWKSPSPSRTSLPPHSLSKRQLSEESEDILDVEVEGVERVQISSLLSISQP